MSENLLITPLFVGLTRPLMIFGVTMEVVCVFGIVILSLCILSNQVSWAILYIPFHTVGWLGCQKDPAFFKIINQWSTLRANPNQTVWGCKSYEPF